jgi:hypothetical protein
MPKNPLAEVFGFPLDNMSAVAINHRKNRLCPFHNSSGPNCTKFSVQNPLGVCSIFQGNNLVITCPVRFRQNYSILSDAGEFFFGDQKFVALTEVRLSDKVGSSAGNIDIVLAVLDANKLVIDFGAIEVQAVYISGNISNGFQSYMKNPERNYKVDWPTKNYPKPDYLSSSRKRLAPQLIFKGGILHEWGKKTAVVVHRGFFEQLPSLDTVIEREADIAWLIYDLKRDKTTDTYQLHLSDTLYTKFETALSRITMPETGDVNDFMKTLEKRIRSGKLFGAPPSSPVEPAVEPVDL